jgi:hypothetical protein
MDPVGNPLTSLLKRLISLLDRLRGLAVWVEITTDDCTYYYGPFTSQRERSRGA